MTIQAAIESLDAICNKFNGEYTIKFLNKEGRASCYRAIVLFYSDDFRTFDRSNCFKKIQIDDNHLELCLEKLISDCLAEVNSRKTVESL